MNRFARLPYYSIALTLLVAAVANILLLMYSSAVTASAERDSAGAQQARLHQAALTVNYFLNLSKQLARVGAAVLGPIRDRSELELNLRRILRASDRTIVYGVAIGYAPYAFESRRQAYGMYAFASAAKMDRIQLVAGAGVSHYQDQLWYTAARDAKGRIAYIAQYHRRDHHYIGAVQGFFAGGKFAGAIAVASLQPALQSLIRKSLLPADRLTMLDSAGHTLWRISNPHIFGKTRIMKLPLRAAGWTLQLESTSTSAAAQKGLSGAVAVISILLWLIAALLTGHLVRSQKHKSHSIQLQLHSDALQAEIDSRALVEERLRRTAYYDPLTGLPNRSLVLDSVSEELDLLEHGNGRTFAVCHIDLDRFSVINDSLGHPAGDELLHMLAQRLAHAIPEDSQLGRIGSDEFIVRFKAPDGEVTAREVSTSLLEAIRAPFWLGNREIVVSASAGVAVSAARYRNAETLLRDADIAMFAAKNAGRDRYIIFDEPMHQTALARLSMEGRIRRGISRNEFVPYYQPIISLADGRVRSVEALARWKTREGELISADRFIPVAEHAGLVSDIDNLVLSQTCADAAKLERTTPGIIFGANLSATCLNEDAVIKRIFDALERNNVSPDRVRFELTESAIMERPEEALAKLNALRDGGLQIVIDDFGTGYSSLSYVQRLPISGLKIDRSFVLAMVDSSASRAIVRTIVAMAKVLGLFVTAEGVETQEQLSILSEMRVDYAQGWFFAQALPYDALESYIATRAMATAGVLHA